MQCTCNCCKVKLTQYHQIYLKLPEEPRRSRPRCIAIPRWRCSEKSCSKIVDPLIHYVLIVCFFAIQRQQTPPLSDRSRSVGLGGQCHARDDWDATKRAPCCGHGRHGHVEDEPSITLIIFFVFYYVFFSPFLTISPSPSQSITLNHTDIF